MFRRRGGFDEPAEDQGDDVVEQAAPVGGLLDIVDHRGVLVARLFGEIDLAGAPRVEGRLSALADGCGDGLVVDLTDVRYLDSSAVRALFVVADRFASRGRELHVVVPPQSRLARLVSIIQLDTVVAVHEAVELACEALTSASGPRASAAGSGAPGQVDTETGGAPDPEAAGSGAEPEPKRRTTRARGRSRARAGRRRARPDRSPGS
jgi:anti-anti-sigma factor